MEETGLDEGDEQGTKRQMVEETSAEEGGLQDDMIMEAGLLSDICELETHIIQEQLKQNTYFHEIT